MSWWTTYYQSSDKRIPAVSKATPRLRVPINWPEGTLKAVTEFMNTTTETIMSDTEYDITEEMLVDFLIEHQIDDADELEEFSQMIHLLMMEPNIPVEMIN